MDINDNNDDVINLIDDDDDDEANDELADVHPYLRMVPVFDPAVYTFLQDDLIAYTPGLKMHLFVRGRPVVLARARHYNGHVVNPTAPRIQEMKRAVQSAMGLAGVPTGPMFPADDVLSVTLVFRMPRPLADFAGRNRLTGAVISNNVFAGALGDVDNLSKLVLDAMNEVLFVDDRQVVILKSMKTVDTVGLCNGSTEILVRKVRARDMRLALANVL
jgi:hypothetical protein